MSLPKIIKTVFYVDPAHGRNYHFDVNNDITIGEIKSMLVTASKVAKIGLRIFDKHTDKEYTMMINNSLDKLFPNKDLIEFKIQIDRRFRNQTAYDQLKLGEHCPNHPNKYCLFYCFDCQTSLCSLCFTSGKHTNHEVFEKFDYLKPSNEIVDGLFSDIDEVLNKVDSLNKTEIQDFRLKLNLEYFPSLIEILKQIETKLEDNIDKFNKHYELNLKTIKNNSIRLKEHCSEGLDELKHQLDIENMLKDEGVFLHFDYKVKELGNEKSRIVDDTEKINKIINSFAYAKAKMEKIYTDIRDFLLGQLNNSVYDEIKFKLTELNINELSKDNILGKLLSDFKKKDGKIISNAKLSTYKNPISEAINSAAFNMSKTLINIPSSNSKTNVDKASIKILEETIIKTEITETKANDNNLVSKSKETTTILANVSASKNKNNVNVSQSNLNIESSNLKNVDYNYIINIYENSARLTVYKEESNNPTEDSSENLQDREITIKSNIHGIDKFLPHNATVNTSKVLYISGGDFENGKKSNSFLVYNPAEHNLLRLEAMPTEKMSHSLIYYVDPNSKVEYVFSVGGHETNSCERYDVKTNKWTKLSNLKTSDRRRPILFIYGSWLYAMFGYTNGKHHDSIERLNFKGKNGKWEYVMYNNTNKIPLPMYGAACIENRSNDSISILGGKSQTDKLKSIISFEVNNATFIENDFTLEDHSMFNESNFVSLGAGDKALFNTITNELLRLNLGTE